MTFNSEFWNLDSEKMLQDVDDFELLEKVLFLALDVYLFFKTPYSLNPPDGDFTLDLEIKGRLRANGNGSNIVVPIINFNGDHISDKYPLLNIKGAKVGTKSYKYRNDGTVKGKFEIKIDDYTKTGNHNKT